MRRRGTYFVVFGLISTLAIAACAASRDADAGIRGEISSALQKLLQRSNRDAFVIVNEVHSKKFVQFDGSTTESLLLDIPVQELSKKEEARAAKLFKSLGALGRQEIPMVDRDGQTAGTQVSYQMDFGRDADTDAAAAVTMRVFREVFQISPKAGEFKLTEN